MGTPRTLIYVYKKRCLLAFVLTACLVIWIDGLWKGSPLVPEALFRVTAQSVRSSFGLAMAALALVAMVVLGKSLIGRRGVCGGSVLCCSAPPLLSADMWDDSTLSFSECYASFKQRFWRQGLWAIVIDLWCLELNLPRRHALRNADSCKNLFEVETPHQVLEHVATVVDVSSWEAQYDGLDWLTLTENNTHISPKYRQTTIQRVIFLSTAQHAWECRVNDLYYWRHNMLLKGQPTCALQSICIILSHDVGVSLHGLARPSPEKLCASAPNSSMINSTRTPRFAAVASSSQNL